MADWNTVSYRRRDPGSKEKAKEDKEPAGMEMDAHEGSFTRFTGKIRAEFAVSGRSGKFSVAVEAKKLFTQMLSAEPDITFKSDTDGRITFRKISKFPTGEAKFKEFFTVTPHTRNDGTGKVHVNFQIESKKRLAFMKRDTTFFNYLRENKIWVTEHKYETHALKSIGFFVKKSPCLTYRPKFESDIGAALNEYMETAIKEGDTEGVTTDGREFTPTMEISSKNVVHVLYEGDKRVGKIETQALEIRCKRTKAYQLEKLLCAANLPCKKFGTFVPYALAKTDIGLYKKVISDNNKFLSDIVAIPVFGLHPNVIDTIVSPEYDGNDDDTLRNQILGALVAVLDEKGEDSGESEN